MSKYLGFFPLCDKVNEGLWPVWDKTGTSFLNKSAIDVISCHVIGRSDTLCDNNLLLGVQSVFKIILICLFIFFISLFYKTKPSLDSSDKTAWLLQDIFSHVPSGERGGTMGPVIEVKYELVSIEDWLVNQAI